MQQVRFALSLVFFVAVLFVCAAAAFVPPSARIPSLQGGGVVGNRVAKEIPSNTLLSLIDAADPSKGVRLTFPDGKEEEESIAQDATTPKPDDDNGWMVSAWGYTKTHFTYFEASWIVPEEPTKYGGETLFFFNSFTNAPSNDLIVQPVLQYGPSAAGGGKYWAVANWYVSSSLQAYYTTPVKVSVGDLVRGVMYQQDKTYYIEAYVNGQQLQTLNVTKVPTLNAAQVTMEVYNVESCKGYPVGGDIEFFDLALTQSPNSNVTIDWQIQKVGTDCGIGASCPSSTNCTITY